MGGKEGGGGEIQWHTEINPKKPKTKQKRSQHPATAFVVFVHARQMSTWREIEQEDVKETVGDIEDLLLSSAVIEQNKDKTQYKRFNPTTFTKQVQLLHLSPLKQGGVKRGGVRGSRGGAKEGL